MPTDKQISEYFKKMNELIDDMTPVFTISDLCLKALGISEHEFDEDFEPYKEQPKYKNEYTRLRERMINKVRNHGITHPAAASMCLAILKDSYGIGLGAVETNDNKIEIIRRIISRGGNDS